MTDVKILGRGDFLAVVGNFKREVVDLTEFGMGGAVYVSEMDATARLIWNTRIAKLVGMQPKGKRKKTSKDVDPATSIELAALMVSLTVSDENGNRLFSEADVKALVRTNLDALLKLSTKAMELSGLNNTAVDEVAANLKKAETSTSTED